MNFYLYLLHLHPPNIYFEIKVVAVVLASSRSSKNCLIKLVSLPKNWRSSLNLHMTLLSGLPVMLQ